MNKVLVLGGYGNFGKRIVRNVLRHPAAHVCIAGRTESKATALRDALVEEGVEATRVSVASLDVQADDFAQKLRALVPHIVVHTSGPFQGQSYAVPQACMDVGAHYVDLSDDTGFVCDIAQLDAAAKQAGVLLVSGASSVPGLSSTVLDEYVGAFKTVRAIDISIAPGNKAERGLATVQAILSYTGHPITGFQNGKPCAIYGWMDGRAEEYGEMVGKRWLANVDVPDLVLFPQRYGVQDSVRFQAGLELGVLHHSMRAMAWLAKRGVVKNWAPLAKWIVRASDVFLPFGTGHGAMRIVVKATGHSGEEKTVQWTLYAPDGVGPYIPTLAPSIVVHSMLDGALQHTGAMPCLGLFSVDQFDQWAKPLGIYHRLEQW